MKRDLVQLSQNKYDLLVIGGGIYGSCVAWDAVLRGLSVALVEKGDFGSATSANTLKIIHGGFRYLQQADFRRMRESICERRTLMKIAPHLVHPIPVLIPTYGHLMQGKELFSLALLIHSIIGFDRNSIDDLQKHTPAGEMMSREDILRIMPFINRNGLTGGAVFYDAQVYNSERLTLAFIQSAWKAGAGVANYVEVTGFLRENDCIAGVETKDILTGEKFHIRAKTVINTSGPWVDRVVSLPGGFEKAEKLHFVKAVNLVTRSIFSKYAVGISGKHCRSSNELSENKISRYLFFVPWRNHTLIGTSYKIYKGDPDRCEVDGEDVRNLLDEVNALCMPEKLRMDDVLFTHGGLLPGTGIFQRDGEMQLLNHCRINDYQREKIRGLMSVVGVKYTTARCVAEKVVDRVFASWGKNPPASLSSKTSLCNGHIERFEDFLHTAVKNRPAGLDEEDAGRLVYNYGSEYPDVLKYMNTFNAKQKENESRLALLKAQTLYGIHNEMALKLSDIVFRRTDLGTAGNPGSEAIEVCANTMGKELGWSGSRVDREVREVKHTFSFKH